MLVVEDDEDAREIAWRMLEAAGARVVLAEDGRVALDVLDEARPDVILCDLRMPRLDGLEFVRRLRADPRRSGLPVIAVTVLAEDHDYFRTWETGFDAHLVKPVDYDIVAATILRLRPGVTGVAPPHRRPRRSSRSRRS